VFFDCLPTKENEMSITEVSHAAAKGLMRAFNRICLKDAAEAFDILQPHSIVLGPSERRYLLDSTCFEAIDRGVKIVLSEIDLYPPEKCHECLTKIVVEAKDRDIAKADACDTMCRSIQDFIEKTRTTGEWEVVYAVRGVAVNGGTIQVANCSFYRMDADAFSLWGQREATGRYTPPEGTRVFAIWEQQERMLLDQVVAAVRVKGADADHACLKARRCIEHCLDLLRYAQLATWPPQPVPELGLALPQAVDYVNDHCLYIRIDALGFGSKKAVSAGDGASVHYCREAPAWIELTRLLERETHELNEVQKRILLALAWTGQAALAGSPSVRFVCLVSALEVMLIGQHESKGKKKHLASRIAKLVPPSQSPLSSISEEIRRLYGLRSSCLHAGQTEIADEQMKKIVVFVSECFRSLLCRQEYSQIDSHEALLLALAEEANSSSRG
jgi:hypothetical protein